MKYAIEFFLEGELCMPGNPFIHGHVVTTEATCPEVAEQAVRDVADDIVDMQVYTVQ